MNHQSENDCNWKTSSNLIGSFLVDKDFIIRYQRDKKRAFSQGTPTLTAHNNRTTSPNEGIVEFSNLFEIEKPARKRIKKMLKQKIQHQRQIHTFFFFSFEKFFKEAETFCKGRMFRYSI